jgi:hypothetical protein
VRALGEEGQAGRRGSGSRPHQIGQHTALQHFALDGLGRGGDANRNRLALADLVFQNAQGLIERGDQKVGDPIADCLLLHGQVGGGSQRSRAGNVASHHQPAALAVEIPCVDKLAAQAWLPASVGERSPKQALIEPLHMRDEVEGSRLGEIERQGKILSAIQFGRSGFSRG